MRGTIYSGIISGRISKFRKPDSSTATDQFQSVSHPRIFARDLNTPSAVQIEVTAQAVALNAAPRLTRQ